MLASNQDWENFVDDQLAMMDEAHNFTDEDDGEEDEDEGDGYESTGDYDDYQFFFHSPVPARVGICAASATEACSIGQG